MLIAFRGSKVAALILALAPAWSVVEKLRGRVKKIKTGNSSKNGFWSQVLRPVVVLEEWWKGEKEKRLMHAATVSEDA